MFNQKQKELFIKEYMSVKVIALTSLNAIFKKTEPFETTLCKDVSSFTKEETLQMLRQFKSKSVNSLLNYVVILKHYSRWMTNEISTNSYELITKSDVSDLVDKSANVLLSREDIAEITSNLLNWSDKAIVWLLFIGIAGPSMRDIYNFSEDNVDFKNKRIVVGNIEYPFIDELIEILPKAFLEDENISYGSTLKIIPVKGRGRIYKERPNALGIDSDDARFRWVYRKIQLFRNNLDMPNFTMKNISAAGLWYFLQLGMKERKLGLREFLKTRQGKRLAKRYGFGDYYIDNIVSKFEQYL